MRSPHANIDELGPEDVSRAHQQPADEVANPVISVVLATYNRADLLPRAIQSVLDQTFTAFELLVVDDASTDTTSEVVAGFADTRIRYLRQPQNCGVGRIRNIGIEHATAEYIVFLDDDDAMLPTFLEEVYKTFSQAPATVGFMWSWKESIRLLGNGEQSKNVRTFNSSSSAPQPGENLLRRPTGGSSGLVVRADALRVTGNFNTELRALGDAELLIRLAKHFDYIVIPQVLYSIFLRPDGQLTTPSPMRAQSVARVIELHRDIVDQYPGTFRVLYRALARIYYQIGNRREGRQSMWQLFRREPLNWRNWVLLLLFENLGRLPYKVRRRVVHQHM